MSRNPLLEAYLASTRPRQPNMAMTEVDSLFNPYTYTSMNDATRVASLPNVESDAETFSSMTTPELPTSSSGYPLLFREQPVKQEAVNTQPVATQTQMSPYDQFQRNIKENVFNPRTNEFEPTTYLLDSIAPNYSQRITNFMTGATPDMSQGKLDAIQQNVRDVQQNVLDTTAAMPVGSTTQEIFDQAQQNFTGFDTQGNFIGPTDPGTAAMQRAGRLPDPEPGFAQDFFSSLFGGGDDGDSNSIFNF